MNWAYAIINPLYASVNVYGHWHVTNLSEHNVRLLKARLRGHEANHVRVMAVPRCAGSSAFFLRTHSATARVLPKPRPASSNPTIQLPAGAICSGRASVAQSDRSAAASAPKMLRGMAPRSPPGGPAVSSASSCANPSATASSAPGRQARDEHSLHPRKQRRADEHRRVDGVDRGVVGVPDPHRELR
jgi:hypothetical protein